MPKIPAFCENCGSMYPSGMVIENAINLKMMNNIVGVCPKCGGLLRTQDGVFNVVNGVIEKLKEFNYTKEELKELSKTVKKNK